MATSSTPWTPNVVRFQSYMPVVRMEAGATGTEGNGNGENPPASNPPVTPPATAPQGQRTFTQEELDAIVTARLNREKEAREKEAAKTAKEAENKRLAEQQEFAKLAAQHESRVKELEPELETTRTERDALRQYVTQQIETATKDWPDSLKKLIPAEGAALARLEAFNTARAVFDELQGNTQQRTPAPGNGPRAPRPDAGDENPTRAQVNEKRATGRYAF